MSSFLHQRQSLPKSNSQSNPQSPTNPHFKPNPIFNLTTLLILSLLSLLIIVTIFSNNSSHFTPFTNLFTSPDLSISMKWKSYTLQEALKNVAKNGTVIVCAVSRPYLPFLNNWLISIVRQKHHEKVLVIAEDYVTLFKVNERWPGHAVLIPPAAPDAPDDQTAHKFGSQGFFNFTSRRPRHLLQILEFGYSVMYNDVDMVWLADPFPYFVGEHDVYFMDDMTAVKPLDHSHDLPPPGKKGRPYICSCFIYMRPTTGAKLVMKKWIEELQEQPWSKAKKANDQPGFNWALMKTAGQADLYLLPQSAFPTGGLYFKNKTWVKETKGKHVIIHNNYIIGFEKKIKRFHEYGLWLVDDHASESPLGSL